MGGAITSAVVSAITSVQVDVTTVGLAILGLCALIYGYYVVRGMIDDADYTREHTYHYNGRGWERGEGDGIWTLEDED